MMNKAISIIALALAGTALLISVFNRDRALRSIPADHGPDSNNPLAAQLEELQQDYQTLRESNRQLAQNVARLERSNEAEADGSDELARLKQRLDDLDARQAQLTAFSQEFDKYGVVTAMEEELVNAYSTLLDTNQPLVARVKQAGKLKRSGHFDDRAVNAMTDLYRGTDDLNEKGAVLSALSGAVTPKLRDQILVDLNNEVQGGNQSARFRYHAIEALEPLLPDPAVQQWLNHLAQNDPEPKIAARAGQPLGLAPHARPAK